MENPGAGEERAGPASGEAGEPEEADKRLALGTPVGVGQPAFLLRLSDALRAAPDADALAHRALGMLAEQLALDRCYIGVYRLAEDWGDFPYQVGNADVPPVPAGVRLSDFPNALRVAFDRTLVLDDVAAAPGLTDADRSNLGALGVRALVAATLRAGEGRPLWSIVAVSARPRLWTPGEVALLEEATERTWAALERARADAALRASEEQFRLAADAVPQIVWITDADGRVEFFNKQGADYTGVRYEPTTVAEVAASVVHPDDGPATVAAFDEARRTGGTFAVEHRIRSATGEYRWFLVRAEPYHDSASGAVVRWFGASVDIHDQTAAEAALRLSEARYRTLFDSIDEGFCVIEVLVDAEDRPVDFRFIETNPAFVRQGGFDPLADGTPSRPMSEIAPIEPEWIAIYSGVAATGESRRFTHEAASFGRTYDVFASRVDAPEARHVAVLFRDITARLAADHDRERLLAQSEKARAAAEIANEAKTQFLAVMSHELRTPLNAIGGYAELIELGIHGPVTPEQGKALARIQRSQRHLLGLIAGVLDYSRVEAGAVTYRIVDVPVTEAVAEAETLVAPQLRAKGLGYAWSGAPPGLCVRADREKLQQILLNLLGNAVKFTEARDGVPGRIEVGCTVVHEEGGVRLHMRDTGAGIAANQLERVFEPFVQTDQSLTRPHAGVGLGLAISRDLARGMGGDLTVESTPGVGSTFTLTLPAA